MAEIQNEFRPNWISPSRDTIADLIAERGWTQIQLAERLGISKKHLKRLVKGKVELTNDMAIRLTAAFGSTLRFWLQREARYRQQSARSTLPSNLIVNEVLTSQFHWQSW